ncbi:MAG TPA: hypothetical protein VMT28_00415 [Terriglobales bacterium]|jgi:hypothetical protein|nr:hypothetical protein [Terriglobales bacterium]
MVVDNKNASALRNALIIASAGLIGLVAGALGGYLGYSNLVIFKSPLVKLKGSSNESPFEQTYRGMARLGGLEASARKCDGTPVPPGIIEREMEVIDQIEASSKKANLDPALNVARAIAAYRGSAVRQETAFLQAAGWKDTSSDHFASIVRAMDDCQPQSVVGKEKP